MPGTEVTCTGAIVSAPPNHPRNALMIIVRDLTGHVKI